MFERDHGTENSSVRSFNRERQGPRLDLRPVNRTPGFGNGGGSRGRHWLVSQRVLVVRPSLKSSVYFSTFSTLSRSLGSYLVQKKRSPPIVKVSLSKTLVWPLYFSLPRNYFRSPPTSLSFSPPFSQPRYTLFEENLLIQTFTVDCDLGQTRRKKFFTLITTLSRVLVPLKKKKNDV